MLVWPKDDALTIQGCRFIFSPGGAAKKILVAVLVARANQTCFYGTS